MFHHLRLLCFTLITSVVFRTVCLCTLCPVETVHPRWIAITYIAAEVMGVWWTTPSYCSTPFTLCKEQVARFVDQSVGGDGGIRTHVQNIFLFASYSHINILYRMLCTKLLVLVYKSNDLQYKHLLLLSLLLTTNLLVYSLYVFISFASAWIRTLS
jgi:hypothetical protein